MAERSTQPRPDPSAVMQLATAYWGSQALLTANRIGLFAALAGKTVSAKEVAAALGTAERPTRLLLQTCVGLGLVELAEAGFRNSSLSRSFLIPGEPAYLGDALRYADDLYDSWGRLDQSLREDAPALSSETYLGGNQEQTRNFVYGMHNRALAVGRALAEVTELAGRRRLLDVGGGPGTYSALLALKHPELSCTVLDLPQVAAIAGEIVESMGVGDRVRTLPGDYNSTEFPSGNDVVLISGVFHREGPDLCRSLIRRAHAALEPGGVLIVSDVFTDASGVSPPFATLFGLNMLLTAPDGGVHRDVDVAEWMRAEGFGSVEVVLFPPPMPHRALVGTRGNEG